MEIGQSYESIPIAIVLWGTNLISGKLPGLARFCVHVTDWLPNLQKWQVANSGRRCLFDPKSRIQLQDIACLAVDH